jgi:hypothetical protein
MTPVRVTQEKNPTARIGETGRSLWLGRRSDGNAFRKLQCSVAVLLISTFGISTSQRRIDIKVDIILETKDPNVHPFIHDSSCTGRATRDYDLLFFWAAFGLIT